MSSILIFRAGQLQLAALGWICHGKINAEIKHGISQQKLLLGSANSPTSSPLAINAIPSLQLFFVLIDHFLYGSQCHSYFLSGLFQVCTNAVVFSFVRQSQDADIEYIEGGIQRGD